jgi:hypothetical protein
MTQHTNEGYSNWAVGWSAFAAVMLILIGIYHAMAGLVALVDDTFYVVGREYVFEFDVTAWGWIHLIGGILVMLAGFGIWSGNVLARTVGVGVAALSAIANFAWLPYEPVWAGLMIGMAVAVIWALTVHGRDLAVSQT